jgi:hypothetical protein
MKELGKQSTKGPYSFIEHRRIRALERRAEFLRLRTKDKPELTYDRQEAGAIEWALRELAKARGPWVKDAKQAEKMS